MTDRQWTHAGLDDSRFAALASELPATQLWSLLLGVAEARASQRTAATVYRQWTSDRFVTTSAVDQRTLNAIDAQLLAAAADFEAIELSPLAPLGACSAVAKTTQNRIVSTMRGTEVVSDPTNVLALEAAQRLAKGQSLVRLATSHRCVRAQEVPALPGFAAHFRMFCMTTAGRERGDRMFLTDAVLHHIRTHLRGLDLLESHGYSFPERSVQLLATAGCEHLRERIAAALQGVTIERAALEHGYYHGLQFKISARSSNGHALPLIDGGAFDWLTRIANNRKLVYVASAIGSQVVAFMYRTTPAERQDR
jgi:hypothetical protein